MTHPVSSSPGQPLLANAAYVLPVYLGVLAVSEALSVNVDTVLAGLVLHSLMLLILVVLAASTGRAKHEGQFFLALALAPLIRITSLSLPLQIVPRLFGYALAGLPMVFALIWVVRYAELGLQELGFRWKGWFWQLALAPLGVALGYIQYTILRPAALVSEFSLPGIIAPALVLLVFVALLEETLFRGLLLTGLRKTTSPWNGVFYGAAIYAVLQLGFGSWLNLVFVFCVGIFLSFLAWRSQSLLGVVFIRGAMTVSLLLVFPFLMSATLPPLPPPANPTPPNPLSVSLTPTPTLAATELPQLVVDDGDTAFIASGVTAELIPQGWSGDLAWALSSARADALAEWRLDPQVCGHYALEVYIPEGYGTTTSATYQVEHRGQVSLLLLDQRASQGAWVQIGEFEFSPESPSVLRLTNQTGEDAGAVRVAFDAARWTLLGPCQ